MSVRKRTLSSGKIAWQVDYRDQQGVRRAKQFPSKGAAVAFETKVRAEIASGVHVADSASITVEEAANLWLQRNGKTVDLEPSTMRSYREHVRLHITPYLGKLKLCKLTRPDIEHFCDTLLETRSRAMVCKVLASVKGILSEAQRLGLTIQNVSKDAKVRKTAARHEKKITPPSKDEIRVIINHAAELWPATSPFRPLIVTAIFSGLRASELRGLGWDCVDFDQRVIRVRRRASYQNKLGSPKSEAGTRDVPMTPLTYNTLRAWRLACPRSELNLVFPTPDGNILWHSRVHWEWRRLLKKLDLDFRFHDLRHAAASLFIEQKMQPKKVQAIMGHSSISVTLDVYGHLFESMEDDQEAMKQIEARIFG